MKQILKDILRVDASLDLGALNLRPPPPDYDDYDDTGGDPPDRLDSHPLFPPPPDRRDNGGGVGRNGGNGSPDNGGMAGGSNGGRMEGLEDDATVETNGDDTDAGIRSRRLSSSSDIQEVEVPRVPTPEIVDLIDSEEEEEDQEVEADDPGSPGIDRPSSANVFVENDLLDPNTLSTPLVVTENAEDGTEVAVNHPTIGDIAETAAEVVNDQEADIDTAPQSPPSQSPPPPSPPAEVTNTKKRRKKQMRGKKKKKQAKTDLIATIKTENIAEIRPAANAIRPLPVRVPYFDGDNSNKIVYRGKLIRPEEKPKPTAAVTGIRKHVHNAFTLTGLKRAQSLVAVKEENAVHRCTNCPAVFQKHRSLVVHRQRMHTAKSFSCPECGKKLSSSASIKKHLLTHRPEHMWPYECPLCHKKFQVCSNDPYEN